VKTAIRVPGQADAPAVAELTLIQKQTTELLKRIEKLRNENT